MPFLRWFLRSLLLENNKAAAAAVNNLLWIIMVSTFVSWAESFGTVMCQSKEVCSKGMGSHGTNLTPVHSSTPNRS